MHYTLLQHDIKIKNIKMQIHEFNIMKILNQLTKRLLYFFSYMTLNIPVGTIWKHIWHIGYENIMFGQIEHQKCHF